MVKIEPITYVDPLIDCVEVGIEEEEDEEDNEDIVEEVEDALFTVAL